MSGTDEVKIKVKVYLPATLCSGAYLAIYHI